AAPGHPWLVGGVGRAQAVVGVAATNAERTPPTTRKDRRSGDRGVMRCRRGQLALTPRGWPRWCQRCARRGGQPAFLITPLISSAVKARSVVVRMFP